MSDIPYEPVADCVARVRGRLAALRVRVAAWFWVDAASRVLWLALGLAAVDLLIDWFHPLDRVQRLVMLALMLALLGWLLYRRLVRPLLTALTDDALALQIEASYTDLGQGLITALQLARLDAPERRGLSPALVRHAIQNGAQAAEHIDFRSVLNGRRFRWNAGSLALALAVWSGLAYGASASEPLAIWFNRNILLGERSWPQQTYLVIERVGPDGMMILPRGGEWRQEVSVTAESQVVPDDVYLDLRGSVGHSTLDMKKIEPRQFAVTLANVFEPFEFRARGGYAVTEWIRVELADPPAVEELKLVVTPPKYAGGKPEALPTGSGPYHVLKGSSLALVGRANKPLRQAGLLFEGKRFPAILLVVVPRPGDPDDAARIFSRELAAADLLPGRYTIELEDRLGLTSLEPTTFELRTRADREPRVDARLLGVSGMVMSQARVAAHCRVNDDFGITKVAVAYRRKRNDVQEEYTEKMHSDQLAAGELTFDRTLQLAPRNLVPGDNLTLQFEAEDNDDVSGPKVGRSSEFQFRIVSKEDLLADLARRQAEQRQQFERLVKEQDDLLTDCRALHAEAEQVALGGLTPSARPFPTDKERLVAYQKRQRLIGTDTSAMAERLAGLAIEFENNGLGAEFSGLLTRLTEHIVRPMRGVADQLIPEAVAALDEAGRRAAPGALGEGGDRKVIELQAEIVAKMKDILAQMGDIESFQEAVNLLHEVQRAQAEVHEQTEKARRERIQRILERERAVKPRQP